MPGAPAFTPLIKLNFTTLNATGESSDLLVSGFPKDWLFAEKAQDCTITNRNLAVEFYRGAAEFAATTTKTIHPALRLQHRCQITAIMSLKPWRPCKQSNR